MNALMRRYSYTVSTRLVQSLMSHTDATPRDRCTAREEDGLLARTMGNKASTHMLFINTVCVEQPGKAAS